MRGKKEVTSLTLAERGYLITIVTCMNATGKYMPPLIVSRTQVERGLVGIQFQPVLSQPVCGAATYRYDDTKGCVMQF